MKAVLAFIAINLACFGIAATIAARSRFYRNLIDDLKGWTPKASYSAS